jgi:dihydropteroate synthase
LLDLTTPKIMGIVNLTTNSFYSHSRISASALVDTVGQMIYDGASVIDLGAQSTRPGALEIEEKLELDTILESVATVVKYYPNTIFSIDTYRSTVARAAVNEGASMINDVSGGEMSVDMFTTIAQLQVPYILMHMQGTPKDMQQNPSYQHVIEDIVASFIPKVMALKQMGVHDIVLDPGIGFGKTSSHNFLIIKYLSAFSILELPLLIGVSRKSLIWKNLGISPAEALNGTTVLNTISLMNGAKILRVHDVKAAKEATELVKLYNESSFNM